MEKALEILKHIEELYVAEPDLDKFERVAQKNPERVAAWDDAFKEYDLVDVLNAIDEFWTYKSSKSRPNVHQLLTMLRCNKEVAPKVKDGVKEEKYTDYAFTFMQRDIKLGRCHHLLGMYQRAVSRIVNEVLPEMISSEEWQKLEVIDRYSKAMQLGLFNEFDEIIVKICRELTGKDSQF